MPWKNYVKENDWLPASGVIREGMRSVQLSNGSGRSGRDKEQKFGMAAELAVQVAEYLLAVVVVAVCVIVPLYARDGYHQIGNAKFEVYRRIMTGGFSVLLAVTLLYCACRIFGYRRNHAHAGSLSDIFTGRSSGGQGVGSFPQVSLTDLFVLVYLILTGISVVSGGFYEDALWGAFGWNMGFASQLSFVLLYLFVSRLGRYYHTMSGALCSVAAIVFGIGILHRLLIDPIGFYDGLTYEQKAQFLSTLGQATWYAAFLSVTLPIGIGVFLYADQIIWRILSGIYTMLGFCTLVTQNSDSAYFALAGTLLVYFLISCEERERLCRYAAVLTMFFGAGKIMCLLMRIRPNPALEPDLITELMWTSGLTWVLFAVCLAFTCVLIHRRRQSRYADGCDRTDKQGRTYGYPALTVRRVRRITAGIVVILILAVVSVIRLQSRGVLPTELSERVAAVSYLNWNDDWGNGRGRIWSFTARVISGENLRHRMFGVGPDCYSSYVNAYHGEEEELLWGEKQLTNAHNEWLNMLVNGGILGAAAYLGIYVTAIIRLLRGRGRNLLLTGIAATCVSYMCYNFFCYQQVLCTPYVFILMGIGEYILRHERESRSVEGTS